VQRLHFLSRPMLESLEPRLQLSGAADLQHSTARLSEPRELIGVAAVGHRVYFAGGEEGGVESDVVDIYHAGTGNWSTAKLSEPRNQVAIAGVGHTVIFAGGSTGIFDNARTVVDVYNTRTRHTYQTALPEPCYGMDAVTIDGKAIFYGGFRQEDASNTITNDEIFIFDLKHRRWSTVIAPTANLPSVTPVGTRLIVPGYNSVFDVYDVATGTWTSTALDVRPNAGSAAVVGTQAIFFGETRAAVYDSATGRWSVSILPGGHTTPSPFTAGNKAVFAGGSLIIRNTPPSVPTFLPTTTADVYDSISKTWSTTMIPGSAYGINALAVVGNKEIGPGTSDGTLTVYDAEANQDSPIASSGNSFPYRGVATLGKQAFLVAGNGFSPKDIVDIYTDLAPTPILVGGISDVSARGGSRSRHVTVTLTNDGDAAYTGPFSVNLYASAGTSLDANSVLLGNKLINESLAPGATILRRISLSVPRSIRSGQYHLVAAARRKAVSVFAAQADAVQLGPRTTPPSRAARR